MTTTEDDRTALTWEFQEWCKANGLEDEGDAEDLLHDPAVDATQRAWLVAFIARWDAAHRAELNEPTRYALPTLDKSEATLLLLLIEFHEGNMDDETLDAMGFTPAAFDSLVAKMKDALPKPYPALTDGPR